MKTEKSALQIEQLERRMKMFAHLQNVEVPPRGWIHAVRTALNMSMRQLGQKLGKIPQTIDDLERAEASGAITLKSLREAGRVLNLKLVYGFVPQEESLEGMIDKRARELAREIVMRTSQSMKLEDQENAAHRIEKAIEERANELKREMPKYLWD
jgi:predicted DNA-binding mobile mystery protein A